MRDELSHLYSQSAYEVLNDHQIGFVVVGPVTGALTAHREPVDIVPLLPNNDGIVLNVNGAAREVSGERPISATTGLSITENLTENDVENDIGAECRTHRYLDLRKPLLMQIWRGNHSS